MSRSKRLSTSARLVICAVLAAAAVTCSHAAAATALHFQSETLQEFERQLAKGEIHAATFNKIPHSLHLSMNDHRHLLVVYPPLQYKQIAAELRAKGVPVRIAKHAKGATKSAKHTLRYIAGGILVLVILVVLVVLLIGRRRDLLTERTEDPPRVQDNPPDSPPAESG